jgi:hypothetical protein
MFYAVTVNKSDLDAVMQDADWSVLEGTLYDLCRKYPRHADVAGTNAKLWLIGRGFATGIERQIKSRGGQGSSMGSLCRHFQKNHDKIDEVVALLDGVEEPLDEETLREVAVAHGRLCKQLKPVLRKSVSPRSFAAKYLHFHCPAVPIYDSYAAWKLARLCRWRPEYYDHARPKEADTHYQWFLVRFWQLYQAARALRPRVTVRQIDMFLLS